jgi:CBS domain-containing protein
VTTTPDRSAREVADLMRDRHVGAILVVDEDGRLIGIVTERELVVRALAAGSPPETPVRSLMSTNLVVARVNDTIDYVFSKMRQHGVRRLPIVADDGSLLGLVALDDLMVLLGGEVSSIVETLMDNRGP